MQTGVPTLKAIYGIAAQGADVGDATVRYDHEPARRGAKPVEEDWDTRAYLQPLAWSSSKPYETSSVPTSRSCTTDTTG